MKLHIVMHESFEGPGAIEKWASNKNHCINYTKVYAGEKLPTTLDHLDLLVVMGGPQSPATTKAQCAHFDSMAEQALIKKAIDQNKAVLGVCLGAQLIGDALGAKFEHSPHREIGIFDVILTDAAKHDPIFSQFPAAFEVAHWHGDMPGLTKEAQVLAYSEGCPRQIIRYLPKVYGFQCHFEFTKEAVAGMVQHCGHETRINGKYIQNEAMLKKHTYAGMNERLFLFLDYMENLAMPSKKVKL